MAGKERGKNQNSRTGQRVDRGLTNPRKQGKPRSLNDSQKRFVVHRLAAFERPSEVAKAVKEEFGVEITRQSVQHYDPTTRQGESLSESLKTLFWRVRKAFREDVSTVPISHKAWRLRELERAYRTARDMRNLALASSLLEQAAKEMGNAFTNRRELTGRDGGPIKSMSLRQRFEDMTDDELKKHLSDLNEEERALLRLGALDTDDEETPPTIN